MQSSQTTTSRIRRTARGCGVLAVAALVILMLGLIYLPLPSSPPSQQGQLPTAPPAQTSADRQRVISAARTFMGEGKRTATSKLDRAEQKPWEAGFMETASGQCWYEWVDLAEGKGGFLYTCRGWNSSEWESWLNVGSGSSWELILIGSDGREKRVSYYSSPDEWRVWLSRLIEWIEQVEPWTPRPPNSRRWGWGRFRERQKLYTAQRIVESDILFAAYWNAGVANRKLNETLNALDKTLQQWGLREPEQ